MRIQEDTGLILIPLRGPGSQEQDLAVRGLLLPLLLQDLQEMPGTVDLILILAGCFAGALGPTTDLGQIPAEQSSKLGFVSGVGGTSE